MVFSLLLLLIMWYSNIQWYISFSLLDCMIPEAMIYDQKKPCISLLLKFNWPYSQHYVLFIVFLEKYLGIGNENFFTSWILSNSSKSYFHGLPNS